MDHLYMSDGPPQPDDELLDVCSDLLHLQKHANAARKIWRDGGCGVRRHRRTSRGRCARWPNCLVNEQGEETARNHGRGSLRQGSGHALLPERHAPIGLAPGRGSCPSVPTLRASIWPEEGSHANG